MKSLIEYQVIISGRISERINLSDKNAKELHTNPAIVMTLLNADQHLDRLVKVIIDGKVRGYQQYPRGRRVTVGDIA